MHPVKTNTNTKLLIPDLCLFTTEISFWRGGDESSKVIFKGKSRHLFNKKTQNQQTSTFMVKKRNRAWQFAN